VTPSGYADTKVAPEKSRAEIEALLKQHGIKDIQWTTLQGQTSLKFLHRVTVKGVEKVIGFELQPPAITKRVRQWNTRLYRYEFIHVQNEPQAYRLLFWYLKNLLLAVEYGMTTVEKVLMQHIIVALPSGEQTTIGENLERALERTNLEGFVALPAAKVEVEQPKRDQSKIIDVPRKDEP